MQVNQNKDQIKSNLEEKDLNSTQRPRNVNGSCRRGGKAGEKGKQKDDRMGSKEESIILI